MKLSDQVAEQYHLSSEEKTIFDLLIDQEQQYAPANTVSPVTFAVANALDEYKRQKANDN